MKSKLVLTALIICLFTISSVQAQETKHHESNHEQMDNKHVEEGHDQISQTSYSCSMRCEGEKTYNQKGECPKCGMNLTKMEMDHDDMAKSYTCSMHPEIKSDQPGDCSKCGMVLIEKMEEQKMKNDHKGHMH